MGEIAFLTGFFGETAARYFADRQLFADLWVRPYLRLTPNVSLVAEVDGVVMGYVLGAVNQAEYASELYRVIALGVIPGVVTMRYRQPLSAVPYLLRTLLYPSPHASETLYPAHLHINLRPEARGLGLGRALLAAFLDGLRRRGVPGVQLSTTDQNVAALKLYRQQGFHIAAYRTTPLWTPWLGKPAQHLCLARSLSRLEVHEPD